MVDQVDSSVGLGELPKPSDIGQRVEDLPRAAEELARGLGWWGGGDEGVRRQTIYGEVEGKRQGIEDLIREPLGLKEDEWREVSEYDLGTREEVLVRDKKPELLPEYLRMRAELAGFQAVKARELGEKWSTPIEDISFSSQVYDGEYEGKMIKSCGVACVVNGLKALGVRQGEDEDGVIEAMGGRGIFDEEGYLNMGKVYDYLANHKKLPVKESGNLVELMQTLINGGVAIGTWKEHTRLIYGAEFKQGQVWFRIHDPASTRVELVSAGDLAKELNAARPLFNLFLVEKLPKSVKVS